MSAREVLDEFVDPMVASDAPGAVLVFTTEEPAYAPELRQNCP